RVDHRRHAAPARGAGHRLPLAGSGAAHGLRAGRLRRVIGARAGRPFVEGHLHAEAALADLVVAAVDRLAFRAVVLHRAGAAAAVGLPAAEAGATRRAAA